MLHKPLGSFLLPYSFFLFSKPADTSRKKKLSGYPRIVELALLGSIV